MTTRPPLPLPRTLYGPEHERFRVELRGFVDEHIAPNLGRWEQQGHVDREAWSGAGRAGYLCMTMPAAVGGLGRDYRYNAIFREELARVGVSGTGLGMGLHSDVVVPMLWRHGSAAQCERWLAPMRCGDVIGAIAMTEPEVGSDLAAISTRADRVGDEYVLNGRKIFITNGRQAGLIVVVAKTDPAARGRGVSLFLVEGDRAGLARGEPLRKLGLRCEDTCELFFDDLRIPAANLLGGESQGFDLLKTELPWERLQIALSAQAHAEAILAWTVEYTAGRRVFGQPLAAHQNTRFSLADCAMQAQLGRLLVDRCVELASAGHLDNQSAAMAKLWCTELQGRVADACLQLHGGHGYLWDRDDRPEAAGQPATLNRSLARAFADARVQRIYAGSNEIMREIIARRLWPKET